MVRRLKSELPKDDFGNDRFPKRVLEALEVEYPPEEKRIHAALRRYSELRQANAQDHAEKFATDFVLLTLKKRLFSSPAAFLRTLEQHESSLRNAKKRKAVSRPTRGVLQRQIDRVDEDYSVDDEAEEATHEALDAASLLFREPSPEELSLLKEMKAWAERAASQLDAKTKGLIRWLGEHIRPGGKWSDERVIIFTEYRATQNWLQGVLAAEGLTGGDRLMTMFGGMDSKDRERIKAAFQTDPRQSPVRILLATDAASRGDRPPEPLLPDDPLRDPVEPEPAGAAQRPHRPARAEGEGGADLPLRRQGVQRPRAEHGRDGGRRPRRRPRIPDAGGPQGRGDPGRPRQGRPGDRRSGPGGDARAAVPARHDAGRGRVRAGAEAVQVRAGPGQADQGR